MFTAAAAAAAAAATEQQNKTKIWTTKTTCDKWTVQWPKQLLTYLFH